MKNLHLTDFHKQIFFGSFIAMFLITMLGHLNLTPQALIRPMPTGEEIFRDVLHKLENHKNTYSLHTPHQFIPQTEAAGDYENARSYALIDLASGEVLREKALERKIPIASLTKIMTAVVALDLAQPDEYITITERAARQIPTKIGVVTGEQMKVSELLEALMLTSANDSAQAIADGMDQKYGDDIFIRAMNAKAAYIGLKKTHFANPQGFDASDHYSTAEDLAVLTHYALTHYPLLAETVSKDYVFLPADSYHKQFDLYNWNGLLGVYPDVSGVKIGNTDDAGKTTIVVSHRNGLSLLAIVLGAPGIIERDLWAAELLDEGYAEKAGLKPVKVTRDQLLEKYRTWKYGETR